MLTYYEYQFNLRMTSLQDFQILTTLGKGAFSVVYKVQRIADKSIYALKVVKTSLLSEKEKENAITEVRILASIKHPNIIAYREAFVDKSALWYSAHKHHNGICR